MSIPKVHLKVDAQGRGELTLDGIRVMSCQRVEIVCAGRTGTHVKFELLAHVECEIHPDGVKAVLTEIQR